MKFMLILCVMLLMFGMNSAEAECCHIEKRPYTSEDGKIAATCFNCKSKLYFLDVKETVNQDIAENSSPHFLLAEANDDEVVIVLPPRHLSTNFRPKKICICCISHKKPILRGLRFPKKALHGQRFKLLEPLLMKCDGKDWYPSEDAIANEDLKKIPQSFYYPQKGKKGEFIYLMSEYYTYDAHKKTWK